MTALTDSLAEGAVQAVLEAGAADRSRRRSEHPHQERNGLCHQRRRGGTGVSAGASGSPGPGCPVYGRGAGQYGAGLEPPLLDPGPGGRHHQPDPQLPAQRDLPGSGGGWTSCLWCGIQSLYGGVLHRPPGRRSRTLSSTSSAGRTAPGRSRPCRYKPAGWPPPLSGNRYGSLLTTTFPSPARSPPFSPGTERRMGWNWSYGPRQSSGSKTPI